MIENTYLSTAYFPPIQYFTKIIDSQNIFLELQEHFPKQTYRNRCHIYGANGLQVLSIPIENHSKTTLVKDIKIAYHTPWQKNHWRSIKSAYKNAPYYDHYIDNLHSFFSYKEPFLVDLNQKIMNVLSELIAIPWNPTPTTQYNKEVDNDWRNGIHPKTQYAKEDKSFADTSYFQLFAEKHGVLNNLSIIDLLFNEGNGTLIEIKKSIKRIN
ncbi:MAG: WbqC family protein [Salinivirgaceae bacterium]|nr:WbqC family protein [Salinivirgaceae bacterium]MDD4747369.1 WbqC family protein [Salinivirgaceae bacterium]MDY0279483.1 WbqC family protein [Salinivirgaceae bacterium]